VLPFFVQPALLAANFSTSFVEREREKKRERERERERERVMRERERDREREREGGKERYRDVKSKQTHMFMTSTSEGTDLAALYNNLCFAILVPATSVLASVCTQTISTSYTHTFTPCKSHSLCNLILEVVI
jgi:uncharacterized membrane protein YdbT with pleckstrin-like domain